MDSGAAYTERVLNFVERTTWDALPAAVQHQSRRCLLDLLGALVAGMETPVGCLMTEFAAEQFPGDGATVLVSGRRVSTVGAALANAFAGNALDIDDGYRLVKGHVGACVLPALLAAAEHRGGCSGATFLAALVVGYEVGIRAGLIRHALASTYHSSGSWGAIAAAAAAGKVLGLDARRLRQALGAAEYHAPIAPMMKGIDRPSMGKDSIGWGVMVGVASTLMAQRGFTGIDPLFDECPEPQWIRQLGGRYEVLNVYFKPYACCRWAQPAVAGALEIAHANELAPEEIERVRVRTFTEAARLSRDHPRDTEEAQYNLAFPVAAALIDGEVGPRQVLPPRLRAPTILALADRVAAEAATEYDQAFPAKAYADVVVTTRDGRTFTAARKEAIWEPPDTLPSDSELEHKFHWLADPVLGERRARAIARTVWRLQEVSDVRELVRLCVVGEVPDRSETRALGSAK